MFHSSDLHPRPPMFTPAMSCSPAISAPPRVYVTAVRSRYNVLVSFAVLDKFNIWR